MVTIEAPGAPTLERLVAELAHVREAGIEPLDVEEILDRLPVLTALGTVTHQTRADTSLGRSVAICSVVRQAVERLDADAPGQWPAGHQNLIAQAQMLMRGHYKTRDLSVADARAAARTASGLQERQYRRRHEDRLLRLVAQAVLDLDREDDLSRWGHALEVGAEVPQTVAMYWLYLFRDHYFRLETAAYALQFDLETALNQLRDDLPSWRQYLSTAVFWNVQFSYLRHRFWRIHGPLWFAPTEEGSTKLNDAVERIEYHDPFPDEYMARLRRIYGALEDPDHDRFTEALLAPQIDPAPIEKAEAWLRRCTCPLQSSQIEHSAQCEVSLVTANCDLIGETVEHEFERIHGWYVNPRYAADPEIKDRILRFRSPRQER